MTSSGRLNRLLRETGASPGDMLEITTRRGRYRGIMMPHHEFSGEDVIVLKLPSGYNMGVKVGDGCEIRVIEKGKAPKRVSREAQHITGKPEVGFIGTGGTISSFVDYRTGGVYPAMAAEEIVSMVPEVAEICNLSGRTLFSMLSEDMFVEQWKSIAEEVAERLNGGCRGVIISHGTDTMGYTSAALSFMLHNLTGPVVMVGAQRSADRPSFDGFLNLLCSARVAAETDIGEVVVVMHSSSSDAGCYVHRGTRVRKMHSSARDAFRSLNQKPIAFVDDAIHMMSEYRRTANGKVMADTRISDNAVLIFSHPGMTRAEFMRCSEGADGIVVAGTGLGHVDSDVSGAIEKRASQGIPVVMTTQCLGGSVNPRVYSRGRELLKAGIIDGADMLPETAYVKLLYALAHFKGEELRRFMKSSIAGELSERRLYEEQ